MNIETMKSVILVILIAFSLVLTVALWNYQPVTNTLDSEDEVVISDTRLDELGSERTLTELVEPSEIVFHDEGSYYKYEDPADQVSFFQQQMQQWNVSNIDATPGEIDMDNHEQAIEMIFQTELPIETIQELFSLPEETELESLQQVFDRVFLVRHFDDQPATSYELWFVNSDTNGSAITLQADISTPAGERAFRGLQNKEALAEQIRVADRIQGGLNDGIGASHIYLPKSPPEVPEIVLQTDSVPATPLQNDLFPSNTLVSISSNNGERRIKTFQRQLTQLDNYNRMEYELTIPNTANQNPLEQYELITKSLQDINSHLGWTNDFRIDTVSTLLDQVQYRMYFGDLPVMENTDTNMLATILISYQQGQIQEYKRPLLKFNRYTNERESISTLQPGDEVVQFIQESEEHSSSEVRDLEIRYTLQEQTNNLVYSLIPEWYVLTSTRGWTPLFKEEKSQNAEVS